MSLFEQSGNDEDTENHWTCGTTPDIKHEAFIGSGGYGEVHKMRRKTGEVFARKIIRRFGDVTREDIKNEANVISELCQVGKIKCRNVVEVYAHGWLDKTESLYFIDMEYCSETLQTRIDSGVPKIANRGVKQDFVPPNESLEQNPIEDFQLPTPETGEDSGSLRELDFESVAEIVEDIVSGLIYLHEQKTVHRDLKPANVLYSEVHKCWKLADFGSAAFATSKRLHTTHLVRGTGGYRAPEILEDRKYNIKADMFALGCTIYEIVFGKKLFAGDANISVYATHPELFKFTEKWPESPPNTSLRALRELTEALIHVDPAQRPRAITVQRRFGQIRRCEYNESLMEETSSRLTDDEIVQTPLLPIRPQVQPQFQQAAFKRKRENPGTDLDPAAQGYPSLLNSSSIAEVSLLHPQYENPFDTSLEDLEAANHPSLDNISLEALQQRHVMQLYNSALPNSPANTIAPRPVELAPMPEGVPYKPQYDLDSFGEYPQPSQSFASRNRNRLKGMYKCADCRKMHKLCVFSNPDHRCERCVIKGLNCGPKKNWKDGEVLQSL